MRVYTISEAAAALHLSVPTVKRYIYEGRLKSTKLPGGHHRIAESEITRLLAGEDQAPPSSDGESAEARVAVLEAWVTELQADVERLGAALEVLSRYCGRAFAGLPEEGEPETAGATHSVLILGPGCRRCRSLYELTRALLETGGYTGVSLQQVQDLDEIAAFGPVLTPALVIDDQLVLSGHVPAEASLKSLLHQHLAGPA